MNFDSHDHDLSSTPPLNGYAGKVVTAVARELVGFIWAIGTHTECQRMHKRTKKAA